MNQDLLKEFTEFCEKNSDLLFWAALLEWAKQKHDKGFTALLMLKSNERLYDTSEWTGEDNPMILFGREFRDDKK